MATHSPLVSPILWPLFRPSRAFRAVCWAGARRCAQHCLAPGWIQRHRTYVIFGTARRLALHSTRASTPLPRAVPSCLPPAALETYLSMCPDLWRGPVIRMQPSRHGWRAPF
ncbi:MAG: hypothetical protein J3K34DRAFT_433517 [Monoraphidium minutum]|nr:MAG: hypothetical protein J3K34DRAFT_433517 [Monoraphidium minutum]